ncbi:MAG: 5'-nucleosidase, partial [Bdellovibrionaceae bacterium]|nr:5'-nucleosidase [Pseudobdellovibrionaceae bacterium]
LGFAVGETPFDDLPGEISWARKFSWWSQGRCGTGDNFEVGPSRMDCDLVDMEAYSLAKVCRRLHRDFVCIKVISDGADHRAHTDWQENLRICAEKLLAAYQKLQDL